MKRLRIKVLNAIDWWNGQFRWMKLLMGVVAVSVPLIIWGAVTSDPPDRSTASVPASSTSEREKELREYREKAVVWVTAYERVGLKYGVQIDTGAFTTALYNSQVDKGEALPGEPNGLEQWLFHDDGIAVAIEDGLLDDGESPRSWFLSTRNAVDLWQDEEEADAALR